jgi:type IV pilus assembly protein PilC
MPNILQTEIISSVTFLDKLLFTKHLSVMVRSGIPLTEGISTLIVQTKNSGFKKILSKILKDLENGESFAKALEKHPQVFDDFYINLIRVGEESGALEKNLDFLSSQLSKSYSLNKKIQGALLYPGLIFSATLVVGGFVALYIMPQLVQFFQAFDAKLPLSTSILLFIANLFKNYGIFIFGSLGILFVFFQILIKFPAPKFLWHLLLLKIPVFGKLLQAAELAKFSRNLGILLGSGVPVDRSLEITAKTLSNLKFQKDLLLVRKKLTKGESIGAAISNKSFWEYPPLVQKMIAVGEKTGKLEEIMLYLGDFYEEEIDDTAKNLSTILEPILLIFIGLCVGFVAIAIISPIYQLTGSISK